MHKIAKPAAAANAAEATVSTMDLVEAAGPPSNGQRA
jgi:hypothetical protein